MSQPALALQPGPETKWTITEGPMQGSVRLLTLHQFTIGRSPECEFILINDPKVSRKHAFVRIGDSIEISSLNERNLVEVNSQEVSRAIIKDGDRIRIGDTEIIFNTVHGTPVVYQKPGSPAQQRKRPTPKAKAKLNPPRLIMIGIAVLGLILFLLPSKPKAPSLSPRSEKESQAEIEAAQKLKENADAQIFKQYDGNINAKQAQENYVRGFRDYRKGQFERALLSFQTCLTLNPDHVLCNRYFQLSQRKTNELIQYQVVLGRKYRDQNQFKSCRASFRNVMVMVKDANSPIYREAKANYDACNALVEGRY